MLVIRFNGPIYDKQDGLDIEIDQKVIKKAIPPQLVPGGLADAIEGAGGAL